MIQRIKNLAQQSLWNRIALNLAIAGIYFLIGWASLTLATINKNASPFWLPSGISVAVVLFFGRQVLPGVFLGAAFANMTTHAPLITSISIGFGNLSEAWIGAGIIQFILEKSGLRRYSEFFAIVTCAILSSISSATIGSFALYLTSVIPWNSILYTWYTWWSGDTVGMMIFLPFALSWYSRDDRHKTIGLSAFIFILLILGIISLVFLKNLNQAFAWSLCPIFILMGFLHSSYFSRLVLILSSIAIVCLISFGFGPFEYGNLNLNFIYVQTLLASFSFSVLFTKPFASDYKVNRTFVISNLIGWLGLFVVIFKITQVERNHLFDDLYKTTDTIMTTIGKENLQYERLMDSGEALLKIKKDPSPQDWKILAESVDFSVQYPGINGYGLLRKVLKKDYPQFLKEMKQKGMKLNKLRILDPEFSSQFDDNYVIYMVEPYQKNISGIGIDVGSESTRREGLVESLKTGDTVVTNELKLVINEGFVDGFLILHPVLMNGMPETWIYSPVVTKTYYDEILRPYFNIFNVRVLNKGKVIYEAKKDISEHWLNDSFLVTRDIKIFNRTYQMEIYPTAEFFHRHSGSSSAMAFLLTLFMLFIIGFLLEQITFAKRAEALVIERTRELEESKIQLIQSSKMASLGEMASGMAHEINNPLTIIMGKLTVITSMIADLRLSRPEIFTEIDRVNFTINRISKIVKGLKSFSRSAMKDPFELVSLKEIMAETLALSEEKFKSEGIELRYEETPNLFLQCRSGQITQVLLNLLNNSHDAVEDLQEKWIRIKFEMVYSKTLRISVTDSGTGISKEIIEKMMEPFFTTKSVGRGTGLGLSIAKGIVEDHGGKLYFDGASTHTRFVIELPT